MTSRVLCLLKGTDTSINGVVGPLNLILRLISDPNCLTRNLTNPCLPALDAAGYVVCQAFPYLFNGFRREEHGNSCSDNCSDTKSNHRSHCDLHNFRVSSSGIERWVFGGSLYSLYLFVCSIR